jgi:tRNA dimethylallyltransferase
VDPDRARAIDARNIRRVVRALEIFHSTGELPSRARRRQQPPFSALMIGLQRPRAELYARIDRRIDAMLDSGWLEEVARLLESGLASDAPAFSAIGYRPLAEVVRGEQSLQEARAQIRRASRQFVRRQANWFKADDPGIHWFEARDGVESAIQDLIRATGQLSNE